MIEKSLGAVAKAGQADLAAVYEDAEPITPHAGLAFMDTPGHDPVTGLVAGGRELEIGGEEFIPWHVGAVT
jgi:altronate hydrolase